MEANTQTPTRVRVALVLLAALTVAYGLQVSFIVLPG